ncbi:hypothetical protein [Kordia zhangzhouensis]|nr:hypothetical protein [Kordia zhangzhouensis]
MKKQEFKTLVLRKKAISNLKFKELKGGKKHIPSLYDESCNNICDTLF